MKGFVQNHTFEIGFALGVVTMVALKQPRGLCTINKVIPTAEQLKWLLQNPEGLIEFNTHPGEKIWILNAASKELELAELATQAVPAIGAPGN